MSTSVSVVRNGRGHLGLIVKAYAWSATTKNDKFTRYSWLNKIWARDLKCYFQVRHGDCEQNVYSKVTKGHSLRNKRFRAGFGAKNEERESKTGRKMERDGVGKKGRKRLQRNPGSLKTAHLACHAWVRAPTFDAVIRFHNLPIKCCHF